MMPGTSFNMKFDAGDLLKVQLLLGDTKNGVPKVMTRAINKTLASTRSIAVKTIAIDLNLTQERIRQDFYISNASYENVSGSVTAKGRPVNLATFQGTTETVSDYGGGVSVKVKKTGTRVKLKHAFMWVRPTKAGDEARTVFQREWHDFHTFKSRFSPWKKFGPKYRLEVETLTGPRIEDEYANPIVLNNVLIEAKPILDANLDHELQYELSQLK